jgi:hypothetical protein
MIDPEYKVTAAVTKARSAADKFDTATATYALISYIGSAILAIVGLFMGWNWLLIGYAAASALVTWFVQSFALMQNAKLALAIAVAETESVRRSKASE